MKFLLCLAAVITLTHPAQAGEWGSSGGGEFLRDQHNPWFVKNVKQVKFCVEVDAAGFSSTPAKAEELTIAALNYWKKEFAGRGELLGIGTQEFLLTPGSRCAGDEDLKLQFGYGTLSEEQRKHFADYDEDPQDYVGIALRTDYDRVNLKGKGFVFIGSDKGSHPYNRGENVAKNLWSHDGLLFRILQHELGHVFGVAHTDSGFMAADFPESMVHNYRQFRQVQESAFFVPPRAYSKCFLSSADSLPCLSLETPDNWNSFVLRVFDGKGVTIAEEKSVKTERAPAQLHFPVKIFLPKEQKILDGKGQQTLKGPGRLEFKLSATTANAQGEKSSLLLVLTPEAVEIFRMNEDGMMKKWF